MLQANALANLITRIRQIKDLGVVCYTGYRWEHLQQYGSLAQQTLLQQIDLLIDGTYIEARHDHLLWRGSNNQRLLLLTKRYQAMLQTIRDAIAVGNPVAVRHPLAKATAIVQKHLRQIEQRSQDHQLTDTQPENEHSTLDPLPRCWQQHQ